MLEKIPPEIACHIINKLTDNERNKLLRVSKEFYDFIQEFYIQSLYGNTLGLMRVINSNLSNMTKNITAYKNSQKFSFFNRQCRNTTAADLDLRIDIFKFILVGTVMIYNFYPHLKAYLYENKPINFLLQGGRIIFPLIFVGMIAWMVYHFNISLANKNIDAKTIEALDKLKQSYPLLSELKFQYGQGNTHFQINSFLDQLMVVIKNTLQALNQYRDDIRGKNIKEINLDNISGNEDAQKILEYFIEQWNDNIDRDYKSINYKKG